MARQKAPPSRAVTWSGLFWILIVAFQWMATLTVLETTTEQAVCDHIDPTNALPPPQQQRGRMPVVDILSVGSLTQPDLQLAQKLTFGSHRAVRHFYAATESDDTEVVCHTNLTHHLVARIANHCRNTPKPEHYFLESMRSKYFSLFHLKKLKNPMGWMCAQKRPMDGLLKVIQTFDYRSQNFSNLPDYLLIMDDDTWVNMDLMLDFVLPTYPPQQAHAVAGCLLRTRIQKVNFTFAYGGYGQILTRQTLANLLRPIHCEGREPVQRPPRPDDDFEALACWRLTQNGAGERDLFREGMSVADLMYAYTMDQPFLEVKQWKNQGFCMHSDWALAYFLNYYHVTDVTTDVRFIDVLEDRMTGYNHSTWYMDPIGADERHNRGECRHGNDLGQEGPNGNGFCGAEAHFCHRITPSHMQVLHNSNQFLHGLNYHPR